MHTVAAPAAYTDPQRAEGGHAVIRLPGWGGSADVGIAARICRIEKDAPVYLAPDGWQANEHAWTPEEVRADGEDLEIVFGPDITSRISEYEIIRIDFAGIDVRTQLSWGNIAPASGKSAAPSYRGRARFHLDADGQVILEGKISDKGATRPYREVFPEQSDVLGLPYARIYEAWEGELEFDPALRQARIASSTGRPVTSVDDDADLALEPAQPQPQPHQASPSQPAAPPVNDPGYQAPETDAPSPDARSPGGADPAKSADDESGIRGLLIPLISGLAVMILLIGAYLLYRDGLPDLAGLFGLDGDAVSPQATVSQPSTQPAQPTQQDETPDPSDDPEEAGPPSLEDLHNRGVAAAEDGFMDDAVGLFRRPLAEGHVPTLLFYGAHYDSIDFSPFLVDRPNDQAALEFYKRACEAGSDEARSRVAALREHLETRAANGDVVADDTLYFSFPEVEAACTN